MIKIAKDRNLVKLNTFRMKVKAAVFIGYDCAADLGTIDWDTLPQPVLPVGEGSNLLFTGDFKGTVLHSRITGIRVVGERSKGDDVFVEVGGGEKWDDFCHWAASKGLWGPENLSAIPGTVGAAPVQNIGAYGVEAGELIDSVECFDITSRSFRRFSAADCAFAYRDSVFKHERGRYVVVKVTFRLHSDFRPILDYGTLRNEVERNVELSHTAADPYLPVMNPSVSIPQMPLTPMLVRDTVKAIRESKLPSPDKVGSAGSFFKNPVVSADIFHQVENKAGSSREGKCDVPHYDLPDGQVKIPAAWLIEFCGFKGKVKGGAGVWPSQPLVLVNASGEATPEEILSLEKEISDKINETFSISLEPEVDHI